MVFDDKGYHFVRQTPRQVIDYLVNYFYQVKSYSVLACLLSHVFNKSGMRVLPFIHRDYVLMPMGTTSGKLTAWVDPLFVEEMVLTGQDNFIRYAFGFVHQSEVGSQDTLILRLRTSLLALGIFRREHYDGPINEDQWLVDFLGLDSSDLLTAAIGHLIVRNIPGERGKLRKVGRRLFLEDFTSEDQKIDEYIEKWGKCPARRRKLVKACV